MMILLCLYSIGCTPKKVDFVVPKDYKTWKKVTKKPLTYAVSGHRSGIRIIYGNAISFDPIIKKDDSGKKSTHMKDGAILIKETYKNKLDYAAGKIRDLTIMHKNSKNKDALNGWMYYVRMMGKKPMGLQKSRMCVGCHEAANDRHQYFDGNPQGLFRDYLFAKFR